VLEGKGKLAGLEVGGTLVTKFVDKVHAIEEHQAADDGEDAAGRAGAEAAGGAALAALGSGDEEESSDAEAEVRRVEHSQEVQGFLTGRMRFVRAATGGRTSSSSDRFSIMLNGCAAEWHSRLRRTSIVVVRCWVRRGVARRR